MAKFIAPELKTGEKPEEYLNRLNVAQEGFDIQNIAVALNFLEEYFPHLNIEFMEAIYAIHDTKTYWSYIQNLEIIHLNDDLDATFPIWEFITSTLAKTKS